MKKNIFKIILSFTLTFSFAGALIPFYAHAATCPANLQDASSFFGAQYCSSTDLITAGLKILFGVIGLLAALFIVWGGFQYITSAGNDERAKAARATITSAVIGLAIAILAYSIVAIVTNTISNNGGSGSNANNAANGVNGTGNGVNNTNNGVNTLTGTVPGNNPPPVISPPVTPNPTNGFPQNQVSACPTGLNAVVSVSSGTINFGDPLSVTPKVVGSIDNNTCGYRIIITISDQANDPTPTYSTIDGTPVSINTSDSFFAAKNGATQQSFGVQAQYIESGSNKPIANGSGSFTIRYPGPSIPTP